MDNLNGGPKKLPTIEVGWDADAQAVALSFDNTEFRTWNFVAAALRMAAEQADQMNKMQQLVQMKQQAMNQAQEQHLRQMLSGGR
jgi:hypothetical protein